MFDLCHLLRARSTVVKKVSVLLGLGSNLGGESATQVAGDGEVWGEQGAEEGRKGQSGQWQGWTSFGEENPKLEGGRKRGVDS